MRTDFPHMPGRWAICDTCQGHGKHSRHLGSYSMVDLNDDPDFRDDYFAGFYDRPCEDCQGTGKVWEVVVARCSFAQKRELVVARRKAEAAAYSERERRAEMGMLGEY